MGTARTQMLRSMGKSESDLGDGKTSIIMTDFVVNFKAEAFMFDELTVDTHIGDLSKTSFRIFYRVMRGLVIIALAEKGLAAFDYNARKVAPVPEVFLEALRAFRDR
jgi:acyl-CoA thioesterase FadM